ncbi:auxin-induced protein 10A5-like [Neltuma alba]|uniref:auxin-induced protein 10A5-like n=1 Tax=Neltuma alba TaxID=207710 RepID=UPI0010A4F2BC|nr:auxin-induced protein 10A5-like [Prosopis alba]
MGFRLPSIRRNSSLKGVHVPKGYLIVYVGEKMKRFVIPVSYLNQPAFQDLLSQAEEEFGFDSPMGGLTIPCEEYAFETIQDFLSLKNQMGFRLPGIRRASSFSRNLASSKGVDVPKGHLAVYVGEKMRRFVIPISYLNQPAFQDLLSQAEEEFGYDHPMGGLTIPCTEDAFENITSCLNGC